MAPELGVLYRRVRAATCSLAAPLTAEDQVVQTMPDVSPTKWHLAHTTWFFETFLLRPHQPGYRPVDERYATLFNSYYYGAGERHPRPQRGHLSRPTVDEVLAYRRDVDAAMEAFIDDRLSAEHAFLVELGINHEEQHQELILTDIKHVLGANPLEPLYAARASGDRSARPAAAALRWRESAGGLVEIGHDGRGFAFDNEGPRHRVHLAPHALADRLVTCGEYAEFIADGGYRRPELWLSDGWDACTLHHWTAPLYQRDGHVFTLRGARPIDPEEPVCHVSYYEADAYARWAGARLPSEPELEAVSAEVAPEGNFMESGELHPHGGHRLFGDGWQWTSSAYLAYPGFAPFAGAVGEYNGKFMSNRMVLRGGSCFTPRRHIRATYRNFFPPDARWQMTGIRLARDLRA